MRAVTERWRGLSQRQLRSLLLCSVALHVAIGLYALAALPLFGIRPICRDGSIDYDTPRLWIDGPLADDYLDAFANRFWPHMRGYGTDLVYVRLAHALDWDEIELRSELATSDVVRVRLATKDIGEWDRAMKSLPGTYNGWLTCAAIRNFADADGMFSKRGPEPAKTP